MAGPQLTRRTAHLDRAVSYAKPHGGSLCVSVFRLYRCPDRGLGGYLRDLPQTGSKQDGFADASLKLFVRPGARECKACRAVLLRQITGGDRARPRVPGGDALDELKKLSDIAWVIPAYKVVAQVGIQLGRGGSKQLAEEMHDKR
jgi:hypothetical protein